MNETLIFYLLIAGMLIIIGLAAYTADKSIQLINDSNKVFGELNILGRAILMLLQRNGISNVPEQDDSEAESDDIDTSDMPEMARQEFRKRTEDLMQYAIEHGAKIIKKQQKR